MDRKSGVEWWGYSDKNGWVVLDRNLVSNVPGKTDELVFIKCNNWSTYSEDRNKWELPYYEYYKTFLNKFTGDALKAKQNELKQYWQQYHNGKKTEVYFSIIKDRHSAFLKSHKLTVPEVVVREEKHRVSGCWNCKTNVDNSIDLLCSRCGWTICGSCGACGCTKSRNIVVDSLCDELDSIKGIKTSTNKAVSFSSFEEAKKYAITNPGKKISKLDNNKGYTVK